MGRGSSQAEDDDSSGFPQLLCRTQLGWASHDPKRLPVLVAGSAASMGEARGSDSLCAPVGPGIVRISCQGSRQIIPELQADLHWQSSQVQLMYLVYSSQNRKKKQLWVSPFYKDEKYTREKQRKSSIRFRNRISTSLHRHDATLLFLLLFPKGSSSCGSIWGNVQPTCTQKQTVLIHSGISGSPKA